MSFVAVAWLAIELAPQATAGLLSRRWARATLGSPGLATVALGAVACALLLARRRRPDRSGIEKHSRSGRT